MIFAARDIGIQFEAMYLCHDKNSTKFKLSANRWRIAREELFREATTLKSMYVLDWWTLISEWIIGLDEA